MSPSTRVSEGDSSSSRCPVSPGQPMIWKVKLTMKISTFSCDGCLQVRVMKVELTLLVPRLEGVDGIPAGKNMAIIK